MTISPRNKDKLPSLIRVKNSDKKKKTVSFSQDLQSCNVAALSKASMIEADVGGLPSKSFSLRHQQSSIREGTESTKDESKRQKALPILPVLQGPQRKADQEYLEFNLFTGPHSVATEALATLRWHQYVRSKQEIRAELKVILGKCKTYFGNVGMGFNYSIGDTDYGRRETRENWRERRKTGIISIDTEQDQFIIADSIAIVDTAPDSAEMGLEEEAKKIAHRGSMNVMITEYKRRMVKRVNGLVELDKWIGELASLGDEQTLDNLDDLIDQSHAQFTEARYEAKSLVKQMRRLLRKMGEKHRMLANRMKVTSKLKERAAMVNKNLKIDYSSVQTINQSFEQIINRQLVLMSATKKMSREAGENDEKLRKIQTHMMRCVKELSDDKEALFHKNHMLSVEAQKLKDRCQVLEEQVEYYENKAGLEKHQATLEVGKTVDALTQEVDELVAENEKLVQEEEALRNEVVDLHDQVLAHEVESGNQKKEISDLKERNENLEFMLNEEKSKLIELEEQYTKLQEENLALRIENSTRPEVAHKTVSIQSLESIPKSVSTVSEELVHHEPEVVYVDRVVENYDVATDTADLNTEMELIAEIGIITDPIEFAEDKKRGLTNPFETDLLAGNMNFLQNVKTRKNTETSDTEEGSRMPEKRRVIDTPGYTQMIVNRLKEERQNDTKRMADYINRERVRTDAATSKLKSEHRRASRRLKLDMKAMLLSILRHRNKIVELFSKSGVDMDGLSSPTIAEIKGNKDDNTTVSLKHTAVEVVNCLDFNICIGLKELQMKIRETVENQKKTEQKLAVKSKKLEKNSKAVETLEGRLQQLKRDTERLKYREQYTNERYRELLKREEDLERAEEAHVNRIEQRLSEMWTKSTTEIKEGLDEILSIQKPKALMEKQLRRPSRPHRPRDRITHTLGLEPVPSEDAEYDGSSFSMLDADVISEEESSSEDGGDDLTAQYEEALPLKIDTKKQQVVLHQQQNQRIGNNANETELVSEDQAVIRGHIHKGIVNITSSIPKSDSEWTERKAEELMKYIEDFETVKPSTINHGDHKFLHFDSCVSKIDEMYKTILQGDGTPTGRRKRRNAGVGAVAATVELYSGPLQHRQEIQLTIQAADQAWNVQVLRGAYDNKLIGIRVYSNALDLIRRNLALKEARFKLLSKRLCRYSDLIAVESLLTENEDEDVEQEVIEVVIDRLPDLDSKHTQRYLEKVHKLVKLNTYILAEQVRVFQQIRDCDLSMTLRFPYPIVQNDNNKSLTEELSRYDGTKRKKVLNYQAPANRSLVKMQVPGSMESVLTTKTFASNIGSDGGKFWRNPALNSEPIESKAEPMSYTLVLDCNALRPHQDVSLPMSKLNPHKAIPPIIPSTLEGPVPVKPTSASFTLPPVVENFSSFDSGIGGSNCILDPAKYM
ncbi:hypothetical protein ACHWQZ_G003003 [Mnemiopsis leidyi]